MAQQETLGYKAICELIGHMVLQNQYQTEQMGKSLADLQREVNRLQEENSRIRSELAQYASDRERASSP